VVLDQSRMTRSVGQLLARLSGAAPEDVKVDTDQADQALRLVGIMYHPDTLMVRVASSHDGVAQLLRGTRWAQNWSRTLRRIDGASWERTTQRFSGAPERFVGVPLLTAIGE
jgi:hypothetical protein